MKLKKTKVSHSKLEQKLSATANVENLSFLPKTMLFKKQAEASNKQRKLKKYH